MTSTMRIAAAVVAAVFLATPAAWADDKKAKNADKSQSQPAASPGAALPQFQGEVQSIDLDRGMMTVRFQDGSVQEFKGNKETLKDYKVGDKIEGKLRR